MNLLEIIVIMSLLMWYIIDRLKPAWAKLKHAKYITMAVAALLAAVLCINYKLDLIYAVRLAPTRDTIGMVLTALLFMGGSSAVSEFVAKIKGG